MLFAELRRAYHQRICAEIIRLQPGPSPFPNFADKGNKASRAIAWKIVEQLGWQQQTEPIFGQTAGGRFEEITRAYLEQAFEHLQHIRPGRWRYVTGMSIAEFDQYEHLARLGILSQNNRELASTLGMDYIITADIIVARAPISDEEINANQHLIDESAIDLVSLSPLRAKNSSRHILHASISCKWTLRSDRSQNTRSEALNLIRHRKGPAPHIVALTAEPLPTRIASLALGTGDIDCVYHFALPELKNAITQTNNEDQLDMLETLIGGRRLRDISDLPLDLAI